MKPGTVWPLAVVTLGLALVLSVFLFRPTAPPKEPPPAVAVQLPPLPPPPAPVAVPPTSSDPLLARWQKAVRNRDAKGVLEGQSAFLAREGEYRDPLMKMAKEDGDPRIRAFTVAVLGRMKLPPPEGFFLGRLADASEHPRVSALEALAKIGTAACLPKVDGLASSDPAAGARTAAAEAAKAVRGR